ncbi:MAG: DMT family transporter [Clostridiales bacterium]|nr:DMT family transporter [Clostridiales bacterium]
MKYDSSALYRTAVLFTVIPLAFAGPLGKLALSWGDSPIIIAFWRQLTATVGTLAIALTSPRARGALFPLTRPTALLPAMAGLLLAGHYFNWYSALSRTTVFNVTILSCLQPFFALAGGWLLYRERTSPRALAAIALAAAGAVMIGFFSASQEGQASLAGDGFAVLSAVFFTGYLLCGQSAGGRIPPLAYMTVLYGSSALILAAAAAATATPLWPSDIRTIGVAVLLTLTATFMVHSVYNWAVGRVGAVYVTVVTLAEPAGASLVSWILFSEIPGAASLAGGALVLAGVILYIVFSRRSGAAIGKKVVSRSECASG